MTKDINHFADAPWPSLEWASWIFDRASFVLVASLLFGLAATIAIVWMGIVKEHHWDLARASANEKIGTLFKDGEQLKKEAEELRKDTATANARTKEAELKVAEVREKVGRPRLLRQETFAAALKGVPPIPVEVSVWTNDSDSHWLAVSLWGALEKSGWPIIQSGIGFEKFRETPESVRACTGNFGGVTVLSKMLLPEEANFIVARPPKPSRPNTPLLSMWEALWNAVGENQVGYATCPFLDAGKLHVVIGPKWIFFPPEPVATPDASAK